MASLTMPSIKQLPSSAQPSLAPLRAHASSKPGRGRVQKRPARVAVCSDSTGHEALMALERRLKTMRFSQRTTARPNRPVQLASLTKPSAVEDSPAEATRSGMTPRRPRFMKPLVARDNAPSAPITPSRPAMPNPGFTSPRRPVSASMPRRRRAPSILKRRRTRSAATRRTSAPRAVDDFVPDGMIVSLPPLLPTHSLLADAYTQGYDCGVTDSDMESLAEVDTDVEAEMALSGSLGGSSSSVPSQTVPSSFVHDMLASLDDSLEEGGFRELLRTARTHADLQQDSHAPALQIDPPSVSEEVPLNDSPTLIMDVLTPSAWNHAPRSPAGFDAIQTPLDFSFGFSDLGNDQAVMSAPAPVAPARL